MGTVEEIWQAALPPGTRLFAGQAGSWRDATSTARLRPRPPGFEAVQGGELAFISLQSLRLLDENLTLATVLARLNEMKAAAVAVLGEVDEDARAAAEHLALPLFVLPAGTNVAEAEQGALRVIVEHQAALYRRAQDAYRQLTELAIGGRGLAAIVERLAHLAGKPAAMEDAAGVLRVYSLPRDGWLPRLEASALLSENTADLQVWLRTVSVSASDPPVAQLALPGGVLARLVAPIAGREGVVGFLSLLGEPRRFTEVDRLAVARGAAACAIENLRQQAALDAQDQLQIGVAEELLLSNGTNLAAVRERALRLGYDLSSPYAALVFRLPGARGADPAELVRAAERELARRQVRALLRPGEAGLAVLYPLAEAIPEPALKKLADGLRAALATRLGQPALSVGVGRLHAGVEGLRLAYQEAEQALSLGLLVLGGGRTIYFGDLGLYRLLFNVGEKDELAAFHAELLGKLLDYDLRNGADLVNTLAAYFAARNSPTEAAERMHVHRNTFLYRLHRIREITGLDLDDPETRLALHLALRIGETLQASGSRAPAATSAFPRGATPRRQRYRPYSASAGQRKQG